MANISSEPFVYPVEGCDECAILTETMDAPTACTECAHDQYAEFMKREAEQRGKNHV